MWRVCKPQCSGERQTEARRPTQGKRWMKKSWHFTALSNPKIAKVCDLLRFWTFQKVSTCNPCRTLRKFASLLTPQTTADSEEYEHLRFGYLGNCRIKRESVPF